MKKHGSNEDEENKKQSNESKSSQGEGESQESSSGETGGKQEEKSQKDSEANQKYELELNGILNKQKPIDWENVKGEVEILYSSIPTITLDLYKVNVNKEDILNFNKEYDNLIQVVKEENKNNTLSILNKLYEYIPKFFENTTNDEIYKTTIETKKYVLSAYSMLDENKWDEISNNIKIAIEKYSKLVTNTDIDNSKQLSINKGYVILNEMQNAVGLKDNAVFLIKYKNLLEEFKNI